MRKLFLLSVLATLAIAFLATDHVTVGAAQPMPSPSATSTMINPGNTPPPPPGVSPTPTSGGFAQPGNG